MMTFPIYEKIIQMFQTTNQLRLLRLLNNGYDILWWFDNYSALLMWYNDISDISPIKHNGYTYVYIYIYFFLCGYNYLTIWDVHIISKVTRDSLKTEVQPLNGTSARFVGSNLWHSLPISKPKQGLLSLLYQIWGFQCDIFFEKKHQYIINNSLVWSRWTMMNSLEHPNTVINQAWQWEPPWINMGDVPRPQLIRNTPYP